MIIMGKADDAYTKERNFGLLTRQKAKEVWVEK